MVTLLLLLVKCCCTYKVFITSNLAILCFLFWLKPCFSCLCFENVESKDSCSCSNSYLNWGMHIWIIILIAVNLFHNVMSKNTQTYEQCSVIFYQSCHFITSLYPGPLSTLTNFVNIIIKTLFFNVLLITIVIKYCYY